MRHTSSGVPAINEVTALVTSFRTEVDDIVGTLDDIKVMFDNYQVNDPLQSVH